MKFYKNIHLNILILKIQLIIFLNFKFMEFDDSERRNIHDDLDELLDDTVSKESPTKKKVAFSMQKTSNIDSIKLDMDKLKAAQDGEEQSENGDGTTAKKKKKRNRKKKNK